jgi:surface protein
MSAIGGVALGILVVLTLAFLMPVVILAVIFLGIFDVRRKFTLSRQTFTRRKVFQEYERIVSETPSTLLGPLVFTVAPGQKISMSSLPLHGVTDNALVYFDVVDVHRNESIFPQKIGAKRSFRTLKQPFLATLLARTEYQFIIFTADTTGGLRLGGGWNVYEANNESISVLSFGKFPLATSGKQFNLFRGTFATLTKDVPTIRPGTSLEDAFSGATAAPSSLGAWNIRQVTSLRNTFHSFAGSFDGIDITQWDTSNVTTFQRMFNSCAVFNEDISPWDVGSATSMVQMFDGAAIFDQNLDSWNLNTSGVNLRSIFKAGGISVENYSATLKGCDRHVTANGAPRDVVMLDLSSVGYDSSTEAARERLIANGWQIGGDTLETDDE